MNNKSVSMPESLNRIEQLFIKGNFKLTPHNGVNFVKWPLVYGCPLWIPDVDSLLHGNSAIVWKFPNMNFEIIPLLIENNDS